MRRIWDIFGIIPRSTVYLSISTMCNVAGTIIPSAAAADRDGAKSAEGQEDRAGRAESLADHLTSAPRADTLIALTLLNGSSYL